MLKENPAYDYVEGDESVQVRSRRNYAHSPRMLATRYDEGARRCVGFHVPTPQYVGTRFGAIGRRHDPKFKALRAENQRRHDLCVARGNVHLSRTSGDWHPITGAEIAAILKADAAKLAASQNSTPPRKAR